MLRSVKQKVWLNVWDISNNYLMNNIDINNYGLVKSNFKTKVHHSVVRNLWSPTWLHFNDLVYGYNI